MSNAAPPPVFQLLNEIGIIAQLAGRRFEQVMPLGMTLAQFTALNHLVRVGDGRSLVRMASALQVTKASMGEVVRKLAEKNLVTITPDPEDGRGKRVYLTEAGRAARGAAITALGPGMAIMTKTFGEAFFTDLTPKLAEFRRWLDASREVGVMPARDAPSVTSADRD
jgi:DNA-binding MarR family transcriptional regulator